jgi:type I restriction enzyme S subunit
MTPEGWRKATYGEAMTETEQRAETAIHLPVLSVTKTRGPMLASERFGKVMHGRDLSKYRLAPRDFVVADPMLLWDGSIGLQNVVEAGLVSPDYRVYKPGRQVDPKFLGYLVRSTLMLPHYQGGARGTNVRRNRIARSDFLAIPVLLPPLGEQKKIAAILSSVDEAIEATQAVIDQLQVVKKAMMAELLTHGVPGRHTQFKQTEIGEVPEEWKVTSLLQLCGADGLQTGPFGSQLKANEYTPEGVPLVMPKDIREQEFVEDSIARIPEIRARSLSQHRVEPGDILFGRRGDIGRCALVRLQQAGWVCGTGCLRARPRMAVNGEYLVRWLSFEPVVAWLTEHAVGQTMLNLNTDILGDLPVVLPSEPEQQAITRALCAVEASLSENRTQMRAAEALKSALMSVLITGEVRVKPDEAAA